MRRVPGSIRDRQHLRRSREVVPGLRTSRVRGGQNRRGAWHRLWLHWIRPIHRQGNVWRVLHSARHHLVRPGRRRTRSIIWQNFVGTLVVDAIGMALAAIGVLGPLLAAFIHVTSELMFILNSARLLPGRAVNEQPHNNKSAGGVAGSSTEFVHRQRVRCRS